MQTLPRSLHIGVIRGGSSADYDDSLKTGAHVIGELSETHKPIDILISKNKKWHMNGVERSPERILKNVDVVWNALHGPFAEDGRVQEVLNHHGVTYAGSDRFSSAVSNNKMLAKETLKNFGIKTPIFMQVCRSDHLNAKAKEIWSTIPHPLAVKPTESGSEVFYKVDSYDDLLEALKKVLVEQGTALVEEYISGKAVECLVAENFRGQEVYAFPPSAPLTMKEKREVEETAKKIHKLLGLRNYSNSYFVVAPKRGVYFLEVQTNPKFHKGSPAHKAVESVGLSAKDFFHHVLTLALNKK